MNWKYGKDHHTDRAYCGSWWQVGEAAVQDGWWCPRPPYIVDKVVGFRVFREIRNAGEGR